MRQAIANERSFRQGARPWILAFRLLFLPAFLERVKGYETKMKAMDFSPDAKRLATGGGTVTLWDCTGRTGPEGAIPNLATGDVAGRLVFSDTKGRPVSAFENAEGISALAWSPDGKYLAAGDAGGRVLLFSD
jgi:WD40 repeat protein